MRNTALLTALFLAAGLPVQAADLSDDAARFVEGNLISTFYHELGHALIDVLKLPVLGQEEDAADTLSVVLITDLWEAKDAEWLARATADYYYYTVDWSGDQAADTAWWGVHGPDEQRYYNHVCLFYGSNPKGLVDFSAEYELPEDRAAGCADEYTLALESWGVFLDEITLPPGKKVKHGLKLLAERDAPYYDLLAEEIRVWNDTFDLPQTVEVRIEPCGEVNAFYFPDDSSITMCTEYAEWLITIAEAAEL